MARLIVRLLMARFMMLYLFNIGLIRLLTIQGKAISSLKKNLTL